MVSFRRDQFRAILLSIVVADAITQGRLPWHWSRCSLPCWPDENGGAVYPGAIVSDRWCHSITRGFQAPNLTTLDEETGRFNLPDVDIDAANPTQGFIEELLATLPFALPWLKHPEFTSLYEENPILASQRDRVMAFYQTMLTCMKRGTILTPTPDSSHFPPGCNRQLPPDDPIRQAFHFVLMSEGDLALSLGQSLNYAPTTPGLPILTGILSACWIGSRGIPGLWLTALTAPAASLQDWLQQRWHISDITVLEDWSTQLWLQWTGQYDYLCPLTNLRRLSLKTYPAATPPA